MRHLEAAESVSIGHPDKLADQISDAILDAYLTQDPHAHVDCSTMVCKNRLIVAGETKSDAHVDCEQIARQVAKDVGYTAETTGLHADASTVSIFLKMQSRDITQAVNKAGSLGAGDQGIMIGYATTETKELMPLPITLAHTLMQRLYQKRLTGDLPYLLPDGKTQVQVMYEDQKPAFIHSIILSCQHSEEITQEDLVRDIKKLIQTALPEQYLNDQTQYFINPSGRFITGGPLADTGLTGRKLMVDTYGPQARHGGGAFSGKDATKVDRSAAYMARYIAKNVVAAKLATRCEIALMYAIGISDPIGIGIDTFNTSKYTAAQIEKAIYKVFDLSVQGIIADLQLRRPIYRKTAFGGHFGRNDPDFTWERIDKVEELVKSF